MVRSSLRYIHRGQVVELASFDPNRTLLDHLRVDRRLVGTKEGCNEGDCGACTVVLLRHRAGKLSYEAVNACIFLLGQIDGAELVTVEDLATGQDGAQLHPVQRAMVKHHGSQCGFCTPGIVMSLFSLYHSGEGPATRPAVTDCLAGNLCRCTGYRPIIDAALDACAGPADDQFSANALERLEKIAGLDDGSELFAGTAQRFFAAPHQRQTLHELLARHPDARLVSGATDVGLWITKKLQDIPRIIWLGNLQGSHIIEENTEEVRLGGGVRLADAAAALGRISPDLAEVMRRFGSVQVRNSGTVGGNIANGSPIGDLAPCFIALGAEVVLASGEGERTLPLDDFFIDYGKQDRAPNEIVHVLRIRKPAENQHFRAYKVSKRFEEDISAVMGAFRIELAGRAIRSARIAFGGMAATPKRAALTEEALAGASIDNPASWEEAIEQLGADYQPISDARATGAYRLTVARALLQKSLFEISGVASSSLRIAAPRAVAS